jgi:hypothetical protein
MGTLCKTMAKKLANKFENLEHERNRVIKDKPILFFIYVLASTRPIVE